MNGICEVLAYWGPRAEDPERIALRFQRMLDSLASIKLNPNDWLLTDFIGKSFCSITESTLPDFVARNVSREDDGTPNPVSGYYLDAVYKGRAELSPLTATVRAGSTTLGKHMINTAELQLGRFKEPTPDFVTAELCKQIALALALAWDPTWCAAFPWELTDLQALPKPPRPWFGLAWITYISPRFAPLVTPPASAITERVAGGGLLMTATEERFCRQNPQHLAVARDIEAALAPINALPWPPDA